MKKNKRLFGRMRSWLKSIFLTGLFALLPLTLTTFIVHFCYQLIARWLIPLRHIEPTFWQKIPEPYAEFLFVILIIFIIGILFSYLVIEPIVHYFEHLINKIPFIRSIYSSTKKLVDFFNVARHKDISRQVVLIEYPRPHYYNIAFLLGSASNNFDIPLKEAKKEPVDAKFVRVFMPNAPNPSTGYFLIIPQSAIIPTAITFEDAIKTIVSCGLITPEQFKHEDTSSHDSGKISST